MQLSNASNAMRIFLREISVGVLNGATLAAIMSVAVFLWFHDLRLSVTVGLALIVNVSIAAVVGTLVPLTLDRLGRDPAVSSSVFVTFVTDFMGFLSFLGLAAVILL